MNQERGQNNKKDPDERQPTGEKRQEKKKHRRFPHLRGGCKEKKVPKIKGNDFGKKKGEGSGRWGGPKQRGQF